MSTQFYGQSFDESKTKMEDDPRKGPTPSGTRESSEPKEPKDNGHFNHQAWNILMAAISSRNNNQVEFLLKQNPSLVLGSNQDELGWNGWMVAYSNGNPFGVHRLMDSACRQGLFDKQMSQHCRVSGSTPLMFAIGRLDLNMVELILCNATDHKKLLAHTDHEGRTPLILLCQMLSSPIGERTAVTFCDSKSIYDNQMEAYGDAIGKLNSILMIILKLTDDKMLLKKDKNGHSAFYYAFCNRRVSSINILLRSKGQNQIEDLESQLQMSVFDYLKQQRLNVSKNPEIWKGFSDQDRTKEITVLVDEFRKLEIFFRSLKKQGMNHVEEFVSNGIPNRESTDMIEQDDRGKQNDSQRQNDSLEQGDRQAQRDRQEHITMLGTMGISEQIANMLGQTTGMSRQTEMSMQADMLRQTAIPGLQLGMPAQIMSSEPSAPIHQSPLLYQYNISQGAVMDKSVFTYRYRQNHRQSFL